MYNDNSHEGYEEKGRKCRLCTIGGFDLGKPGKLPPGSDM